MNNDALMKFDKKISNILTVNAIGGLSYTYNKSTYLNAKTDGLNVPGLFTLKNSINPVINTNSISENQISSLFANIDFQIWKPFYLSLTGRNDWVSTLPVANNSFFYPSASFSYVISDMFKMPNIIDILKIRASWAQVNSGNTGSTYGQIQINSISSYNNMPTMRKSTTVIPADLKPAGSRTTEFGGVIGLLDNRINIDFSYFYKLYYDNIVNMNVSVASGYSATKGNAREYSRKGYDLMLLLKPVVSAKVNWDLNLNLGTNHRYLKSLEAGKDRDGFIKLDHRTDGLYKISFLYAPDGQLILNSAGMPIRDSYQRYIGNEDPDFSYGIQNRLSYKNFTLQISMEGRIGGLFGSIVPRMGRGGTSKNYDYQLRLDAANGLKNYVPQGVVITSGTAIYDFEGNITSDTRVFAPNTTQVSYQDWFKAINASDAPYAETWFNASYLKVRDVSLTYSMPSSLIQNTFLSSVQISLVGNNLLIFTKKETKWDDPSYNAEGSANLKTPTPINFGVNINLTF